VGMAPEVKDSVYRRMQILLGSRVPKVRGCGVGHRNQ